MQDEDPRPPRRNLDVELADAIERAWRTRFGKVAVVVEWTLAKMRRGA